MLAGDTVIKIENIGKRYLIGKRENYLTLAESLSDFLKNPMNKLKSLFDNKGPRFWALKNISFDVKKGEVIGVIGSNGAGKSTLLKILSRITEPTEGRAEIKGRLASLLEVGTGFHPELTGRENVYLNGSILGMRRSEIDIKFDEIVEFSGVRKFLDTPVKRYSSGMYVRLAFSVAAHLEPEILLVDEVLAVGDASFQKKCLGKMRDVSHEGRTIFFVSHNMAAIQALCSRTILIEKGSVSFDGNSEEAISKYLSNIKDESDKELESRVDRTGNGKIIFTKTWITDQKGNKLNTVLSGSDIRIAIEYKAVQSDLSNLTLSLALRDPLGNQISDIGSERAGFMWENVPQRGCIYCNLKNLPLNSGYYSYNVCGKVNGVIADWVQDAGGFSVDSGDFHGTGRLPGPEQGHFLFRSDWELK